MTTNVNIYGQVNQITEILVDRLRQARENACDRISFGLSAIGRDEGPRVMGQSTDRIIESREVKSSSCFLIFQTQP